MNQKQAVIGYLTAVCLVTFVLFGSLKRADASPEAVALAYAVLAGVGGLGVGGVMTHFRK